jgi:hypothetical protein
VIFGGAFLFASMLILSIGAIITGVGISLTIKRINAFLTGGLAGLMSSVAEKGRENGE